MEPATVEAIERATIAAVAPPEVLEIGGWLAPFDSGAVGRAKSAAPLSHMASPAALEDLIAAYQARGLPPAFRVADVDGLAGVRAALGAYRFQATKPTWVEIADTSDVAEVSEPTAELLDRPDDAWGAVFLGEGFDPTDGAHRVAVLTRSPGARFGAVRVGGRTVAVGAVSFGHGWAGVHGMRTAVDHRAKGYAGRLLATFAAAAQQRGLSRMCLQVEEANPARSLYRRAGFAPAWRYRYWG